MIDMEYLFRVDRGSTFKPHDDGIVAVVDGSEFSLNALFFDSSDYDQDRLSLLR